MSVTETVSAFNSLLRTLIAGVVVGGVGYVGGWVYTNFAPDARLEQKEQQLREAMNQLQGAKQEMANQQVAISELESSLRQSHAQIDRLDLSLRLLKVDQRVAEIVVTSQYDDPNSGEVITEFAFQETSVEGEPLEAARTFRIEGDLVYVDYWVVKFDDPYVEAADLDRSTSLCLFRRVFGEFQEPYEGYTLDDVGARPSAYGSGEGMTEFERRIWNDFWTIANDSARAASMGIRAAHGEAVSVRLRPGMRYRVTLRASDGLSISPVGTSDSQPRSGGAK